MSKKEPLIVTENTFIFKKGTVLENYSVLKDGILTEEKHFLAKKDYVILNEKLSVDEEKRVRELIRQQLKVLFWNLYTKQGVIIN